MSVAHWSRVAATIAFAQAALSFAFFLFLGIHAEVVFHNLQRPSLIAYLAAAAFVLGVPTAFVWAGLAFRSRAWSLIWLGVALEGVWVTFAIWAMLGQALDHDVDFLNNIPVYTMLALTGLAAAVMALMDGRPGKTARPP